MKLHVLTIIGALISALATVFYVYLAGREFLGGQGTLPFLFLALLLGMVSVSIFTWFKPEPMPIWLAFVGIMLSTYNGSKALGDEFLPALLTGVPFMVAAILVLIGEKIKSTKPRVLDHP